MNKIITNCFIFNINNSCLTLFYLLLSLLDLLPIHKGSVKSGKLPNFLIIINIFNFMLHNLMMKIITIK